MININPELIGQVFQNCTNVRAHLPDRDAQIHCTSHFGTIGYAANRMQNMHLNHKRTCFRIDTNNKTTSSSWNILQATTTYYIVFLSNECFDYKQLEYSTSKNNEMHSEFHLTIIFSLKNHNCFSK